MKQITARLKPGQDLRDAIEMVLQKNNIKAGVIASMVGSLDKVNIRFACMYICLNYIVFIIILLCIFIF